MLHMHLFKCVVTFETTYNGINNIRRKNMILHCDLFLTFLIAECPKRTREEQRALVFHIPSVYNFALPDNTDNTH